MNILRHLGILGFIIPLNIYVTMAQNATSTDKEKHVVFITNAGNIKVKLYNETPKHRDNIVKLVNEHFYDSLLFHRVIESFMIQGGDPQSKNASPGATLGMGETGYTIPAEFNSKFYHKKGALAAARQGDEVNPTKASSGCQFYIVQGKIFSDSDLDGILNNRINQPIKQKYFTEYINKPENRSLLEQLMKFQQTKQYDSLNAITAKIEPIIVQELTKQNALYSFSQQQRNDYKTIGGAPHLDNNYTVFGEVVEGIEVVDQIAKVAVDRNARPNVDVRIIKAFVE